ncbi:ABC transporter ATP-binding protein [Butyrivibrio sp. AE2032]|uniref:ABC transporter ATP-binding protein n=1 Tax=Butyrivibrio sp. AE2032 TaxID=1458463 RepID=UPI00054DAA14|nr:ABC transporter ATP-binding protein [Butyrivibrio sp. AE2032]
MDDLILKVENVGKDYILGTVNGETLKETIRKSHSNSGKLHNESFTALDDISFSVNRGETLGIIGANGAGKSTLLKLISRITSPTRGRIYIDGKVASLLEVGTGFHPELTGRENIYLNGSILGMSRKEIDTKIDSIIEFSECGQFIDTPVKRYSSGMYVKLAFAVSAHLDADILIMDEVLAVGDVKFQHKCINKMREIAAQEQRTILYVSHNMESVRRLCKRCIILDHGKLIYDGNTDEACKRYFGNESKKTDKSADYTEYVRPGWLGRDDVRLLSADYVDSKEGATNFDNLSIRMRWHIEKPVEKVGIRVELADREERIFATAVFYDQISGEPGDEGESVLTVDLSHIVNGEYKTFYTVFCVDQYGENSDLDCVKGIDIAIKRKKEKNEELNWRNGSWGNVLL